MLVTKSNRYKNTFVSYRREQNYRDTLTTFSRGRHHHHVYLTTFNNIYKTYELISVPVSNGTYKVKVTSVDDKNNESSGVEGTKTISFFPLPPTNLEASVSGNDVTLTWEYSVEGAPTSYKIYGNGGSGTTIDRSNPLATISGALLTYTLAVANGAWRFVVEAVVGSSESESLNLVVVYVPTSTQPPHKPGPSGDNPLSVTGLVLEHISVGKVKIRFLWLYGAEASTFRVYHDSGTGTVDYSTPAFSFSRSANLIQEFTTDQLHATEDRITYKFVVRARTPDGVEDDNEDEYEIEVDGAAPEDVSDLTLDSVF